MRSRLAKGLTQSIQNKLPHLVTVGSLKARRHIVHVCLCSNRSTNQASNPPAAILYALHMLSTVVDENPKTQTEI